MEVFHFICIATEIHDLITGNIFCMSPNDYPLHHHYYILLKFNSYYIIIVS